MLNKSQKQISRRPPNRSTRFLHRVHVDVVGPINASGVNGEKYWIIYTDDYSRYRWIDIVDSKAAIEGTFLQFLVRMETQHNVTVAIVHTDNDTTLINKQTRKKLERRGTVFEASTPYTAHQNGVAESSNRLNETRTRCMVNSAPHLPKDLWPYAARYSIDILNHTPTTAVPDDKTPR